MAKKDSFYFDNFVAAADYCCKAAQYLESCLHNYDAENIRKMLETMHEFENNADKCKHAMSEALAKAFVTPMDREDMALISADIDEVADCIEEVLQRFYMNHIEVVAEDAKLFATKIVECCELMKQMLQEVPNFKKGKKLKAMVIELSHKEEECDRLYLEATYNARNISEYVFTVFAWREIFSKLEKCADACEHVGDCVETIVMKNT